MTLLHRTIGIIVPAIFIIIMLWGLICWIRNSHPGKSFWTALALGQGVVALQVLFGAIMLVARGGMHWLHYAYGAFPVLVLLVAHRTTRRLKGIEWAAFSVASFFIVGLQLRGLMTGLTG